MAKVVLWALIFLRCSNNPTAPLNEVSDVPILGIVDAYPAWSPDGHTIAYYRTVESNNGPPGMYAIEADGTGNHLVLKSPALLYDLRFSPTGTRIAFVRGGEIFSFDLNEGNLDQITNTGGQARSPDWSPDEERIVYMSPFGSICIAWRTTLRVQRLPVVGGDPRWSPLGEPIVFWSGEGSSTLNIFSVRSDGSDLRELTHGIAPTLSEYPRWLNGGASIFFSWRSGDTGRVETRIMHADGTRQERWPTHLFDSEAISPDSQEFVLIRAQEADSLGVLFVQGTNDPQRRTLRQLTRFSPLNGGDREVSHGRRVSSWMR